MTWLLYCGVEYDRAFPYTFSLGRVTGTGWQLSVGGYVAKPASYIGSNQDARPSYMIRFDLMQDLQARQAKSCKTLLCITVPRTRVYAI